MHLKAYTIGEGRELFRAVVVELHRLEVYVDVHVNRFALGLNIDGRRVSIALGLMLITFQWLPKEWIS